MAAVAERRQMVADTGDRDDDGTGRPQRVPERRAPVHVRREPGATSVTVALEGELDSGTVAEVERQLRQVAAGGSLLVLDLSGLTFMDSSGIALVLRLQTLTRLAGWELTVIQGPPQVQRLLELTGVAERLRLVAPGEPL